MVLLIAVNRGHTEILRYLLDELCGKWSHKHFQNLVNKLPFDMPQIRSIVFGSKTAHAFMASMSLKKQNQWLLDYVRDLCSQEKDCRKLLAPFTKRPYAGMFLHYLLFEESS